METENYLRQSVGYILAILSNHKTQLPFLTDGGNITSAVESIDKLLQCVIPRAPPVIPTPDPTPTPKQTIPVSKQFPINVPTIIPNMPNVTVQVQRFPIVRPNRPPVQVHKVPLKPPRGTAIPAIKSMPLRPVIPILNTWRHDPYLRNTNAETVDQLVIK